MNWSKYLSTIIISLFVANAFGQGSERTAIETSDPVAIDLLDKITEKLNGATNYSAEFTFKIEHPEEEAIIKEGSLIQEAKKFFVDLADQTMTCDGSAVWTHYLAQNEVQITDVEESTEGFNNPSDFLSIHEKEDFVFGILSAYNRGKQRIKEIEFKPIDSTSEFSKVRIVINDTSKEIKEVLTFFKNGSRYTMTVKDWKLNVPTTAALFTFDASKFPGVYVEDLRF